MELLEILKIVGAILGIIAFGWKVWDFFARYLHIDLNVDVDTNGGVSAKAMIENKGARNKRIDNALLLIGPESESPIETFNILSKATGIGVTVNSTNEIAATLFQEPKYDDEGRSIVPLPFFYSENIAIGDERLAYRAQIKTVGIEDGKSYSVRFFVWGEQKLHRSTHDSFRINPVG